MTKLKALVFTLGTISLIGCGTVSKPKPITAADYRTPQMCMDPAAASKAFKQQQCLDPDRHQETK